MQDLLDSLEDLLASPFSLVSGIVTTILSLWGLLEICQVVRDNYGALPAIGAVAVLLLVTVVPFLLTHVLSARRRFALPARERFLFSKVSLRWLVKDGATAEVECSKSYLFFREPEKEDLFDTIFSSELLDLSCYKLQSRDARAVDLQKVETNHYKVYWEPQASSIEVGEPYQHNFKSDMPGCKSFTSKSFTVASPVLTAALSLEIESELPIYHTYAYKKRWWQRLKDHESIVKTAQTVRKMKAPPITTVDECHFTWNVRHLKRGDIFYIVLLFKEEAAKSVAA